MNYWIVTTEFPPAYGGGIGTYCYHTARMLQQDGRDVTVFLPAPDFRKNHVRYEDGIRIIEFSLNHTDAWNYMGYETALAFEFAAVIENYLQKEGVPDILESQEYAGIAYYILQKKHLNYPLFRDLKVILTLHAPSFLYYDYNRVPAYQLPYFWIGEMERWCIIAADQLQSPSCFMRDAIQPYFSTPLKKTIHIVPYPYQSNRQIVSLNNDPRYQWIFFGKLTPQKGILPLLQSFQKLWQNGWDDSLKVIGGGDHYYHPENTSMWQWIKRKYATEIRTGKLQLLGNLSPTHWNAITNNSAVIIVPSIGDNFPFTVLESMADGQLVLTSVQGGQKELIQSGRNGFLFDHTVSGDLENKIKHIAALPREDVQKIREAAAASVVQNHTYKKVRQDKIKLVNELISQSADHTQFPFTREFVFYRAKVNGEETNGRLLSIVIPYFNMGAHIGETLHSVYQSDYSPIEVIVINDGSDEENTYILEELKKEYSFRLLHQINKGLSEARNMGAAAATGEFLAFIDADDKIDPAYYQKAVGILRAKENINFVGSWVRYFEGSKATWPSFIPEPPYLLYYNMVCGGGLVYNKTAFLQHGLNDSGLEYGLEDWDSVISLVANGIRGVVIPEPLYHYRVRKGSIARRFTREKLLFSLRYISRKHSSVYAEFATDLAGLLSANGPGYKNDNPTIESKNYGILVEKIPFLLKGIRLVKRTPWLKKAAFRMYSLKNRL